MENAFTTQVYKLSKNNELILIISKAVIKNNFWGKGALAFFLIYYPFKIFKVHSNNYYTLK